MNESSTLLSTFFDRVGELADRHVALARKEGSEWREWTWAEYGEMVGRTACGMAELGFRPGDRATILSANRPEWLWADLATMCLGGAAAGIYPNDLADQVAYINEHAGARFAFVENAAQLAKTEGFRDRLESLERIVVMEPGELPDHPKILAFRDLLEAGRARYERDPAEVERMARAIDRARPCMIVYTSGTTGAPKGAQYDHRNLDYMGRVLSRELGRRGETTISFLPLCHIAERLQGEVVAIYLGNTVKFAESLDRLPQNLLEIRPTLLVCVPRLWEKFHAGITARFAEASGLRRLLVDATLSVGARVRDRRNHGRSAGVGWGAPWWVLERLVAAKVKRGLGLDRCHTFISGAAPLAADIGAFFGALGMDIREVYGQTESVGVITVNPERGVRPGTVGLPLAGTEVRIGEEGEILARGEGVFIGYLGDPDATRETVDPEGWLHTGDVGEFTEEGYLKITDRLKDIIVTAGGKNVAPQRIEKRLKLYPGISQVVVLGDARPYLVALITLDESALDEFCDRLGIPRKSAQELARDARVRAEIQRDVDEVNAGLARYETIKYFDILPQELTVESGEMTPTLKVKRRVIQKRYADRIEALYATGGQRPAAPSLGTGAA